MVLISTYHAKQVVKFTRYVQTMMNHVPLCESHGCSLRLRIMQKVLFSRKLTSIIGAIDDRANR